MSDEGEPSLQLVADGVHAWIQPDGTWWLNNAGAVVTDAGVLVVDTCATERRTRAFLTAVQQISGDARVYGFGRGAERVLDWIATFDPNTSYPDTDRSSTRRS